ncbi:hypothetical protein SDRG_10840 [Saprolegnia diclina VS20]|uniref:Uncharacterized protein n=1 Tax=Saprolegnia diclina (strain VS20) TaxID=1156394 RepID=T0QDL3_SAPDV|nr:hypothetical protein SDRG_10840 [Saprolegnia diclina VS20]EQC31675.1 hypothetical protein SDRG_10840 [Saprolegnia diclina VS20]|eukprot:XP_008615074.1 hypothetical protein SDRG_10840 [Saprolegnia diclina VS20]
MTSSANDAAASTTTARRAAGAGRGFTLRSTLSSLPSGRDNNDSMRNNNNDSTGNDDDGAAMLALLLASTDVDVDMGLGQEMGHGAADGHAVTVDPHDHDGAGLFSFCPFLDCDEAMGSAAYDDATYALLDACVGLDVDMGLGHEMGHGAVASPNASRPLVVDTGSAHNSGDIATNSSAATSPDAAGSPVSAFDTGNDNSGMELERADQDQRDTVLHEKYYRNTAHNVRCFPTCDTFDGIGIESYRLHTRSNGQCSAPYTVVMSSVFPLGQLRAVADFCPQNASADDAAAPSKSCPTTTNVTCSAYSTVVTFPPSIWKVVADLNVHNVFYLRVRLFDDETLVAQHNSTLFQVCNIPKRRPAKSAAGGEKAAKRARIATTCA